MIRAVQARGRASIWSRRWAPNEGKYSGSEVKIDDDESVIMREEDVLAILA